MIYAKCIENEGPVSKRKYPLEIGKMYEVDYIDMGSSSTDILLKKKLVMLNGKRLNLNKNHF